MPRLSFCHCVHCAGKGCHGSWMPDPFVDPPPLALLEGTQASGSQLLRVTCARFQHHGNSHHKHLPILSNPGSLGMAGTALTLAPGPQPLVGMKGGHWHHRQDWHLTSSGVGLEYQPPLPFLPPAAQSTLHQPLPLASEQLWKEGDTKHLATTTVLCHNVKTHGGVLSQPHHPIPPPHWQVHFNKDLQDKLHLHAWRFPLATAHLVSEMQECFPGWPSLAPNGARLPGAQVPRLVDHHCDGPSKQVVPTTQNPALAGRLFYLQEEGALHQLEPYASVPARDFRPFSQYGIP
ncbi:uncharacterized protein LOC102382996 isoform X2 [Alligator sinensis]|uniref:Uncharacterized protein LOC102382996 isoform X2 n=1 Tax=Alligator sinensis TaxID=38654 RepID=A0A3Q0G1W1_ALLSI|nr:uncharacterized protein LOC102382996 isoform X2 [Alligator sinensis]